MALKPFEMTLAQFRNFDSFFQTDHEALQGWLVEIEEAIEDGETVPFENVEAFETKPENWMNADFESNVDINTSGAAIWGNVGDENRAKIGKNKRQQARAKEADRQEASLNLGPMSNRGKSFK